MKIIIIDFEASSLHGWPIEIGWCLFGATERATSRLIRPCRAWSQLPWDDAAQDLHGITYDQLVRDGRDPIDVVAELEIARAGGILVADGGAFDARWLAMLYGETSYPAPALSSPLAVLSHRAPAAHRNVVLQSFLALEQDEQERPHRAGPDAEALRDMMQKALSRS